MKLSVFVLAGSGVDLSVLPAIMDDERGDNKNPEADRYAVELGVDRVQTIVWNRNLFYSLDGALNALKDRLTTKRLELLDDLKLVDQRLGAFEDSATVAVKAIDGQQGKED